MHADVEEFNPHHLERILSERDLLVCQLDPPFFLSSCWINTWARLHWTEGVIVRVWQGDRLVAMSLWGRHRGYRHRMLRIDRLCLHATGDQNRDLVTIEYNGILGEESSMHLFWLLTIQALYKKGGWNELMLPGITTRTASMIPARQRSRYLVSSARSAAVNLASLAQDTPLESYISSLGKSTREKLRRALRMWQNDGGFPTLRFARTAAEGIEMIHHSSFWHRYRWGKAAMDYPFYARFHHQLVHDGMKRQCIQMITVESGGRPFAWLYHFISGKQVLFYYGAFDYSVPTQRQPGIVAHALSVAHAAHSGFQTYDFMAGNARYKDNLGKTGPEMVTEIILHPRSLLVVENLIRWARSR